MQKGILRSYFKSIFKKIVKYIKNYVKGIIEEINVKSFKKYKYNLLFEFIGSFIFVFFISTYMLKFNQNEEYIIKSSRQINPYKSNDIFISGDRIIDNEINNVMYIKNLNDKINMKSILIEKKISDIDNKENIKGMLINDEITQTQGEAETEKVGNKYIINEVSPNEERKNDTQVDIKNDHDKALNEDYARAEELEDKVQKTVVNNKMDDDTDIKVPFLNEKISHKEITNEENSKNDEKYVNNKEPSIKNVEKIIFKNNINEFSKIKIDDINNINLENINQYEVLKDTRQKNNSNYFIYSFIGYLIYVIFIISGAHINPSYTYALWILEPKKYGFTLSTLYVAFQYIGGILASILCAHMYGSIFIYSLLPKKKIMKTFLCEFFSTFLLSLILISLYMYKKRYREENNNTASNTNESTFFNSKKIKKMASFYSFNQDDDSYGYDMFDTYNRKNKLSIYIDNKYLKYIINNIFYLLFIFFSSLFFVFVTNTTLNPMFSTSTLYTYLYFKIFKAPDSFNLYSIIASFLSITKIIQLIKFYIQSLPLWIGPYFGSTFATYFIGLFQNDEETVNVIDANVYNCDKREKMPLINKYRLKQSAYLVEYIDNIDNNSHNYLIANVF